MSVTSSGRSSTGGLSGPPGWFSEIELAIFWVPVYWCVVGRRQERDLSDGTEHVDDPRRDILIGRLKRRRSSKERVKPSKTRIFAWIGSSSFTLRIL